MTQIIVIFIYITKLLHKKIIVNSDKNIILVIQLAHNSWATLKKLRGRMNNRQLKKIYYIIIIEMWQYSVKEERMLQIQLDINQINRLKFYNKFLKWMFY